MVEEDDGTSGQLMEGLVKNKGSGKPLTGFRQGSDLGIFQTMDHLETMVGLATLPNLTESECA